MQMKLYENYPDNIKIDGIGYPINTDFRLMMRFELCIQHDKKDDIALILAEFYRFKIPADIKTAIDKMTGFYLCGETNENKNNVPDGSHIKRCYAFDEDQRYIIAAFRQQYGIDLINSRMHWWEFSALFAGLTDMTEFVKIMQYRCIDANKIKNDAEKKRIKRLQQRYALPEARVRRYASAEERDRAMINELRKSLMKQG